MGFPHGFSTWSSSIKLDRLLTWWLKGSQKCLKRSCQAFLRLEPKIIIVLLLSHFIGWSQLQGQPSSQCGSRLNKDMNGGGSLLIGGHLWKLIIKFKFAEVERPGTLPYFRKRCTLWLMWVKSPGDGKSVAIHTDHNMNMLPRIVQCDQWVMSNLQPITSDLAF